VSYWCTHVMCHELAVAAASLATFLHSSTLIVHSCECNTLYKHMPAGIPCYHHYPPPPPLSQSLPQANLPPGGASLTPQAMAAEAAAGTGVASGSDNPQYPPGVPNSSMLGCASIAAAGQQGLAGAPGVPAAYAAAAAAAGGGSAGIDSYSSMLLYGVANGPHWQQQQRQQLQRLVEQQQHVHLPQHLQALIPLLLRTCELFISNDTTAVAHAAQGNSWVEGGVRIE